MIETDAGLRRTLVATQRTFCETDACETDARFWEQRRASSDTSRRQSGGAHFIDWFGQTLRIEVADAGRAETGHRRAVPLSTAMLASSIAALQLTGRVRKGTAHRCSIPSSCENSVTTQERETIFKFDPAIDHKMFRVTPAS